MPIRPDNSVYVRRLNPVKQAIDQYLSFIKDTFKVDDKVAKQLIREITKKSGTKDPVVSYNGRNFYGDMEEKTTTLNQYLGEVSRDKLVAAPSLTSYFPHRSKESLVGLFLLTNAKARAVFKKKKFLAVLANNPNEETLYDNRQKVMKVYNNTASGMQASTTTVFYNPTGHSSLTSTTRCVSGIGNSLSESIVGGNRYYKDADSTFEYIIACATVPDKGKVRNAIDKFKLNIPTPEYIFTAVLETSRLYWSNLEKEDEILNYLKTLSEEQLCSVCYTNDLYNLRNCNEEFIHGLVTELSKKIPSTHYEGYEKDLEYFEDVDIEILTKYLCSAELKGKQVDFKKMKEANDDTLYMLAKTAKNVHDTLNKYYELFDAFFFTTLLPPNLGYIKDMVRRCIVISDTDSTCCSYDEWVKWYSGNVEHNDLNLRVASSIMSMTSIFIGHGLKILSANIGTSSENMERLQMKNEFYWPTFTVADISKHYFALTTISEGVVFPKAKREKKGSNLFASKMPSLIRDTIDNMIDDINSNLHNNGKISLKKYIDICVNLEKKLYDDFKAGECYMFLKDTIKEAKTYKGDPEKTKFRDYYLWKDVFEEKYGSVGKPPFVTYSVKLLPGTKLNDIIEGMSKHDPMLAERFKVHMMKAKRAEISTFRIPKLIADKKGLPKELLEFVDIKDAIEIVCNGIYIILNAIGYTKKPGYLISDMIGELK